MNYGEKTKDIRKRHGMSATALAEHLGTSQSMISQVERGLTRLSEEKTLKMATLFNVPVEYFINESYVSLSEFDIDVQQKRLLSQSNLMDFVVLANDAVKNDVSIKELKDAIDFIIQLKKRRGND